jgi:hypothetical protein
MTDKAAKSSRFNSVRARDPTKTSSSHKLFSDEDKTKSTLPEIPQERSRKNFTQSQEDRVGLKNKSQAMSEALNDIMLSRKIKDVDSKKKSSTKPRYKPKAKAGTVPHYAQPINKEASPLPFIAKEKKKSERGQRKKKTQEQMERDEYVEELLSKNSLVMHVDPKEFAKKNKYRLPSLRTDKRAENGKNSATAMSAKSKSSPMSKYYSVHVE